MALFRKAVAEFIGTFTLVFIACGVAAFTGGELVPTALAFGLALIAMAYSIGKVSGCHINPAVSLGVLLTGGMKVGEFLVYLVSQVLGGFVGGVALFGICDVAGVQLEGNACNGFVGETMPGGMIAAIITEVVLTCLFVYVILNVTDKKQPAGKGAGVIIGLTLTAVHLIGINLTGTSVNPARSFAMAFGAKLFNVAGAENAVSQLWVFIAAPLVGAIIAAVLYKLIHREKAEK